MKWKKIFTRKRTDKQNGSVDTVDGPAVISRKPIQKPCCKKCALVCKCKHHRRILRSMTVPPTGILLN
uniref:Uncharacterized protein n=1 Tax=Anopheles minimus TaxID=112268 RepID=A0A182WP80_9DIPT